MFTTGTSRLKSEQKEKGNINLETKYSMILTNRSLTLYRINEISSFSSNN